MRSMALASAPVCSLLLVLKLANCSLLVLIVAENWLHGLRFVWVRATHMTVGQKSRTKILILGGHNRHFYMILQVRYVASRKEIPQNTS